MTGSLENSSFPRPENFSQDEPPEFHASQFCLESAAELRLGEVLSVTKRVLLLQMSFCTNLLGDRNIPCDPGEKIHFKEHVLKHTDVQKIVCKSSFAINNTEFSL